MNLRLQLQLPNKEMVTLSHHQCDNHHHWHLHLQTSWFQNPSGCQPPKRINIVVWPCVLVIGVFDFSWHRIVFFANRRDICLVKSESTKNNNQDCLRHHPETSCPPRQNKTVGITKMFPKWQLFQANAGHHDSHTMASFWNSNNACWNIQRIYLRKCGGKKGTVWF